MTIDHDSPCGDPDDDRKLAPFYCASWVFIIILFLLLIAHAALSV